MTKTLKTYTTTQTLCSRVVKPLLTRYSRFGSQIWDTTLATQAIIASNMPDEYGDSLRKIKENPGGDFMSMYHHFTKGGWTFSDQDHGWAVSDCTAESLKCLLILSQMPLEIAGEKANIERLYDAVNVLLYLQIEDKHFALLLLDGQDSKDPKQSTADMTVFVSGNSATGAIAGGIAAGAALLFAAPAFGFAWWRRRKPHEHFFDVPADEDPEVEQRRKEALSRTGEESQSALESSLQDVVSRYSFMWVSKNVNKKTEKSALANGAVFGLFRIDNQFKSIYKSCLSRYFENGYLRSKVEGLSAPGLPAVSSTLTASSVVLTGGGTPNAPNEFLKAAPPALLAFIANLPTVEGPAPDIDFVLSICLQSNIPTGQTGKSVNPSTQLQTGPAPSASDLSGSSKPHPVPSGSSFKTTRDRKRRDADKVLQVVVLVLGSHQFYYQLSRHVECTVSVIQALVSFLHLGYREKEIKISVAKAISFLEQKQWPDGSWCGYWGICFIYGTFFALRGLALAGKTYNNSQAVHRGVKFLLSVQNEEGGWGESFESCPSMSRWSKIARRLPGRTDNEIKNYWRSHLRKNAQVREQGNYDQSITNNEKQDVLVTKFDNGDCTSVKENILRTTDDHSDVFELSNYGIASSPYEVCISDWMSSWSNEQREVNRHHGECQSLDSDVQKIHFRDGIRANVWFVWIVFNSSTKGGKKKIALKREKMGETAPFWRFSATSYPDLETATPAGALLRNPSRPLNGNSSTSSRDLQNYGTVLLLCFWIICLGSSLVTGTLRRQSSGEEVGSRGTKLLLAICILSTGQSYPRTSCKIHYGSGSIFGFFSQDNVRVGDVIIKDQVFTEATKEGLFMFLLAQFDGIIGLGFQDIAVGQVSPV
ncbi:unnamed protein product [Camellia sinensis]